MGLARKRSRQWSRNCYRSEAERSLVQIIDGGVDVGNLEMCTIIQRLPPNENAFSKDLNLISSRKRITTFVDHCRYEKDGSSTVIIFTAGVQNRYESSGRVYSTLKCGIGMYVLTMVSRNAQRPIYAILTDWVAFPWLTAPIIFGGYIWPAGHIYPPNMINAFVRLIKTWFQSSSALNIMTGVPNIWFELLKWLLNWWLLQGAFLIVHIINVAVQVAVIEYPLEATC